MDIQLLQKESGEGSSVIQTSGTSSKSVVIINIHVAILTKFATIRVKRGKKAVFLRPINSKVIDTSKGKRKEKKKELGGRKEEKSKKQVWFLC